MSFGGLDEYRPTQNLKTSPPQGENRKPPLGVMPEFLFEEGRIKDLSTAIYVHIQEGFYRDFHADYICGWCEELIRRLKRYNENKKE